MLTEAASQTFPHAPFVDRRPKLQPAIRWSDGAKLVASIAVFFALLFFISPQSVGGALYGIGLPSLVACAALLALSQYLSSVRFHYLLRDLGIDAPRHETSRANIYGIVSGLLFFNALGQGVTRSVLLSRYHVPQPTVFFLTLIERAVAMLVLLVAALVSAALLFSHVPLPVGNGGALLLRYVLIGTLVLAYVLALGLTRRQRRRFWLFSREFASVTMLRLIGITVLMHAATLAAYVAIAITLVPTAHIGTTAAVSVIVMLVASFPISFVGWGFRELSASLAYAQIGFAAEQGFAVGVAIGLLAIIALGCNLAEVQLRRLLWPAARGIAPLPRARASSSRLEYPVYWLFGLGAAIAVLFQVHIPTNSGELNVNLGDPIAIIGALMVFGLAWQARTVTHFWRVPWLVPALSAVTIVLAVGLLRSYAVYGPIDWAIFNRFIGWLVLLAYFCTGALIVIVSGRVGFGALSRVLAAATVGLVAWELVHRFLAVGFDAAISDLPARAEAVAGNANAFAFQLLMAFAALVATTDFRHRKSLVPVALGGLLLAGLWLAGSRASVGALAAMVVAIPVLFRSTTDRPLYFRKLALATVIGASVLIIPDLAAALVNWGVGFGNIHAGLAADTADIQADRVESLRGGFAMWAQHPIFGAGLGAYVRDHIARTGIALVIHNSALWVAAEMGLVGLCAFGALFTVIGRAVWTQRAWARTDSHVLVVGCVVGFAVMSLAHDMLYQRPLWLLLGASLASPCAVRSLTNRKPRPAPAAVADPLIA